MDKMMMNNQEVVLVNVIREGKDAWAEVYAVPASWANEHNINQYDWKDATTVPTNVYNALLEFPKVNITRLWES